MADGNAKKSDLRVRVASAVVMLVIAGAALWLGGVWLQGFIGIVAAVAFAEMAVLVWKAFAGGFPRALGHVGGALYIGLAAYGLANLPLQLLLTVIVLVIATDTGAYFSGRAIGGPKIAPAISPSKTWAGLFGGMVGAALVVWLSLAWLISTSPNAPKEVPGLLVDPTALMGIPAGAALAVAAQAGDFFESWLKRRAGVKDSSRLIPGHGGVFDRIDGMLPVALIVSLLWALAKPA